MLSILIPVYNYNVLPLVKELHEQVTTSQITFEIIVIDDCSTKVLYDINIINDLSNTQHIILDKNIGRSAIRNLLASKARFDNLLFVDSGTFPKSKEFIVNYTKFIGKEVVVGGMIEDETEPSANHRLRWLYTKTSEAKPNTLTSANFLIQKKVILNFPFNENIITYGYEDVLFFSILKSESIKILFIDNPVIHDPKEDAQVFLKKNEMALENLARIKNTHEDILKEIKIIRLYNKLSAYRVEVLTLFIFRLTKLLLIKNLMSSNPSIFIFNFYKLGYFCGLKPKN